MLTLKHVLKQDETYGDAHLLMALIYQHKGNHNMSSQYLEAALSFNFEVSILLINRCGYMVYWHGGTSPRVQNLRDEFDSRLRLVAFDIYRAHFYVMYPAPAKPRFFLTKRGFINAILY